MKNRNLILGFAALVFAAGTAFASLGSSPTEDSILIPEIMSGEQCRVIPEQACNGVEGQPCEVRVILNGTNVGNKAVNNTTACTQQKFDDRAQPINEVLVNTP